MKNKLTMGLCACLCGMAAPAFAQDADEGTSSWLPPGDPTVPNSRPRDWARANDPQRFEYHEGMEVPEGYHLEETPRWGLVAGGASVLATFWAVSAVTAVALDSEASEEGDPNFDDMYWPMFIPVAGPFVAIGTADSSGTGAAILALDGAIQIAGLAMFVAGFAAPTVEVVEDYKITITPAVSGTDSGIQLSGSF